MGKYDDAIRDYRFILIINPHHVTALKNLGIVLKNMKRYEESSIQFQKCLQINPNDNESLKYLKEIENLKKQKLRQMN